MKFRIVVLITCLLLPLVAQASGVQATLDRSKVQLGETVTLNLRTDGGGNMSTPDLSALSPDFDILGTSSSNSISIINGRQSSQLTIGIALRPKHVGQLQIPSLTVAGGQTAPLQLEVIPPDPSAAVSSRKNAFIETIAEPDHGYVGQQIVFTVRLFFSANLSRGALDDPQLAGVDVRRLGSDTDYTADRGGQTYHVIERRYALTPQRAGTLVIPSLNFQGEMVEAADPGDPNDPSNFFAQSGLFGNMTPVSANSPSVSIQVSPVPTDWGTTTWLPARQLTLTLDGLPGDGQLHVGQPLNLHMRVQAAGLSAETLPEPSLPTLDGARVYPDQPVDSTKSDGQWLTGQRERGFAVVPERAGKLVIPATTLKWFNVLTGHTEVASIPARTLTVLPAIGAVGSSPTTPASATTVLAPAPTPAVASSTAAVTPSAIATPWRWIALGSMGLWLLSLFAWWLWRKRKGVPAAVLPAPQASTRASREAFLAATRNGDTATQARNLLAWARAERPALQNLGELAAALASDAQCEAIAALQRRQYAGAAGDAMTDLHAAFVKGFEWRNENTDRDNSPLPPLYPFKL